MRRPARALALVPPPSPAAQASAEERRFEYERRRTLMTMDEAAVYLRYDGSAHSVYTFLRKHGVHLLKRGNRVLVRVGEVDRLLETGASDLVDRALEKVRGTR